jgi:hypothetical protein
LIGFAYDWDLFQAIQTELRRIGLQGGLPQLIQTIVARPLITTETLFPDGVMLLGYLLLFTSPWTFQETKEKRKKRNKDWTRIAFFSFPLAYLTYLALIITGAEPIGSGQGFWGWYVYPLFPYLTILVGYVLVKLWHSFSLFESLITTLILGSSMIRYGLILLPREFHYRWQHLLVGLILLMIFTSFLPLLRRKQLLSFLFIIFVGVNLYTSLHLSHFYSSNIQPH